MNRTLFLLLMAALVAATPVFAVAWGFAGCANDSCCCQGAADSGRLPSIRTAELCPCAPEGAAACHVASEAGRESADAAVPCPRADHPAAARQENAPAGEALFPAQTMHDRSGFPHWRGSTPTYLSVMSFLC